MVPAMAASRQELLLYCIKSEDYTDSAQVRKETLPWVEELVQPFVLGPPEPLQDTVPPQQLGDPDSRWIEVDGVNLHYKDTGPQNPDAPAVLLLHGFNGSVYSWYVSATQTNSR